jgi:hypothetical protein
VITLPPVVKKVLLKIIAIGTALAAILAILAAAGPVFHVPAGEQALIGSVASIVAAIVSEATAYAQARYSASRLAPKNLRGLLPFMPSKHARFKSASDLGFSWPTPIYPIDKSGGVTNFGMGGNGPDQTLMVNGGNPVGDCGPNAAPKNCNIASAALLGLKNFTALTSNQIVTLYFIYQAQLAGISWRPSGDNWTAPGGLDNGVDLGDWALWLFSHDINGNPAAPGSGLIDGFVKLDVADMDAALSFGFAVICGVCLTAQADDQFPGTWTVGPGNQPNPLDGHAIERLVSQSPSGPARWATWGGLQWSTLAWDQACVQQAIAVFDAEQALAAGFPVSAAQAALKALGGTVDAHALTARARGDPRDRCRTAAN